jgi:beta-xylosidase
MRKSTTALLLALLLLLAACSAPGTREADSPTSEPTNAAARSPLASANAPQARPSPANDVTEASPVPTPADETFENPILRENFADPFVLKAADGHWYAYATNASGKNIQTARSKDLVTWELLPDAMPALAKWAKPGGSLVWAPEVAKVAQDYVLYYTARDKASNRQCVGVAIADKPEGRFKDTSDKPLVCQANEGGTIDASPFQDGNKLYLFYKNDGNCCNMPTYIYAQELARDGLSLVGEPVRLVRNDKQWEGNVVEAPTMVKHGDKYFLFFSANSYGGLEYAVGYATCETVTGPCTDAPENPILKSQLQKPPDMLIGPGHQTLIRVDDQDWLVYHGWEVLTGGRKGDRRLMYMNRLEWQDSKPVVVGPLTGPQPMPASESP